MKEKIMSDRTDHRAEAEASCYNDDATKHALLAIIDLLDERLPKPVKNESVYLPGEPVEPGDLRAGDRVSFPWNDEYITCNLVTVHGGSFLRSDAPDSDGFCPDVVSRGCRWAGGISDVRLIERAPREAEDPDEALIDDVLLERQGDLLRRIANELKGEPDPGSSHGWDDLPRLAAEATSMIEAHRVGIATQKARAEQAEAERDALRGRLDALRAGLSRLHSNVEKWHTRLERDNADGLIREALRDLVDLVRDDERAAKGEQR